MSGECIQRKNIRMVMQWDCYLIPMTSISCENLLFRNLRGEKDETVQEDDISICDMDIRHDRNPDASDYFLRIYETREL